MQFLPDRFRGITRRAYGVGNFGRVVWAATDERPAIRQFVEMLIATVAARSLSGRHIGSRLCMPGHERELHKLRSHRE